VDIINTIIDFIKPIIETIMGLIGGGEGGGFDISSITGMLGGLLPF
jgi:phage-related protein